MSIFTSVISTTDIHRLSPKYTLQTVPIVAGYCATQDDLKLLLADMKHGTSRSQQRPSFLSRILNYKACRGAVMFRDPLTIEECRTIIQDLGECRKPFQCAHGRPSMKAILNLDAAMQHHEEVAVQETTRLLSRASKLFNKSTQDNHPN